MKFRQALFTNGTFKTFHYWGFTPTGWIPPNLSNGVEEARENSDQWTGMVDKDGREIYVRDIVENLRSGKRYPIIFDTSGRFGVEFYGAAVPPDTPERWRIVGNAHEPISFEAEALARS